MDTVQKLRAKAQAAGNLKTTKEQKVVVEKETIIIESASPEVIYVPSYNPTVVYGSWPYPAYPPYYYYPPVYATPYFFGAGIAIGAAWGYAWGHSDWHGGHVNHNYNQNININNNINRGKYQGQGQPKGNWQHNASHRGGVAYRDQKTAQQYNRGAGSEAAKSREAYRGRAEQGRQDIAKGGADQFKGKQGQGQFGGMNRSGSKQGGGAYSGMDRGGASTRDSSSRGSSSRQSVSSGSRGGGSSYGGGGGGSRGGGGGGGVAAVEAGGRYENIQKSNPGVTREKKTMLSEMNNKKRSANAVRLYAAAVLLMILIFAGMPAEAAVKQKGFASPEDAVKAFVAASRANDDKEIIAILGNGSKDLLYSGDPVSDKERRKRLLEAYDKKNSLVREGEKMVLVIGENDWPFPFPLVNRVKNGSSIRRQGRRRF